MKRNNVLLGIVVFNEQGRINLVLEKLEKLFKKFSCTVIFVDDKSTDDSPKLLSEFVKRYKNTALIVNDHNSGVGKSIRKIIAYGTNNNYDICVIMAGNGKDNPLEIVRLLKPIWESKYDYVQGSRFLPGGSFNYLPIARKFMIKGFTLAVGFFTGFYGTDASNGFRAYKLSIFKNKKININQRWLDKYEFETYLHYKIITLGYKICEVPVSKNYLFDVKDYSKIKPIQDWWKMLRPLIFLKTGLKT